MRVGWLLVGGWLVRAGAVFGWARRIDSERFFLFMWVLGRVKRLYGDRVCAGQSVFRVVGWFYGCGDSCVCAGQSVFWVVVFGVFGMGARERKQMRGVFLVRFLVCYCI